jgi:hypothetical protein
MVMRSGYSVGRTTKESSLADQLNRYKTRPIIPKDSVPEKDAPDKNPSHESLVDKCIAVLVDNFAKRPVSEDVPPEYIAAITNKLPTGLPPIIGARHIYNENYWKRCCVEKYGWRDCNIVEHGFLWKQVYFEKLLTELLEDFDAETQSVDELYELVDSCMDYIFTIKFQQLPSHLDIYELASLLPNLSKLDICYGVKQIGMNYERMLFGMKISDATSLARLFDSSDTIATVKLSGNIIDDDLLRMLMTGLIRNNTIVNLDLSHNKITNHGARLVSKLLRDNSVVTQLDLSDNQIHADGGRYLGRGLRGNDSLLTLNLRQNRLGDDGCRMVLEGLQDNITLKQLNMGSNGAGHASALTLATILRDPEHKLTHLDFCSNQFTADNLELLRVSVGINKTLKGFDLRRNPGTLEVPELAKAIEEIVYANEIAEKGIAGENW